jgi:hypothetical protein
MCLRSITSRHNLCAKISNYEKIHPLLDCSARRPRVLRFLLERGNGDDNVLKQQFGDG